MIEVRLFGDLRRYAGKPGAASGVILQIGGERVDTVGQLLASVGIPVDEVGNLFLNGRLFPRSGHPVTLGYPLAASVLLSTEAMLNAPLQEGDRVGIFPPNMSVLVV